ncbi:MAG: hypothetical protein HRU13_02770, partial [Phycisphaerales bacterium]|nr:hypothetical protein [Phycisphaerales bacterium]
MMTICEQADSAPMPSTTVTTQGLRDPLDSPHRVIGASARSTSGSRRRVVLVTIAAQAVLMAVGWAVTFREVRSQVAQKFADEIVQSNIATTQAVGAKLAETVGG